MYIKNDLTHETKHLGCDICGFAVQENGTLLISPKCSWVGIRWCEQLTHGASQKIHDGVVAIRGEKNTETRIRDNFVEKNFGLSLEGKGSAGENLVGDVFNPQVNNVGHQSPE